MLDSLKLLLTGTLRRQLVSGMVLVVATMMTLFIWSGIHQQRSAIHEEQSAHAVALAQSVATSSSVWVASRDFSGLQEILNGLKRYPDLHYAIILDPRGQVLAHTDTSRRSLYLSDLPKQPVLEFISRDGPLIDVANPITLANNHIGWVRIGLGQQSMAERLRTSTRNGVYYAIISIILSVILVVIAARRLTRRLYAIQSVADAVQAGHSDLRANISGEDEAAKLARQFNEMLDTLAKREREIFLSHDKLLKLNQELESRVALRTAEINDAKDKAEQANAAKSEFLSSMSHELRTPMNAILGFGQLLEYDDTLSEVHRDSVHEILKAGHHLLELINEVLDLAKVESGHIDLSLEPVEVCILIDECLSLVSTLAVKRDIRISHQCLPGVAARADRTRLKQALLNLLSNAIKYNRDGGSVTLDVKISGTDRLRILVKDSGHGIPASRLAELFQPFNRLDAENSGIEGTGIGLTITRRIVELMGGTVEVSSVVGTGSTFWVELPLESLPMPEQGAGAAESATPPTRTDAAQHTVLYIEDNPTNIKLVAQILGSRKHINLLTAHTPGLGIELAQARQPQLILLDINMPGMDGYHVLATLKADAALKNIPVIAVTANAMPRDIERGIAAGFDDYLTKPLNVPQLLKIVDETLFSGERQN